MQRNYSLASLAQPGPSHAISSIWHSLPGNLQTQLTTGLGRAAQKMNDITATGRVTSSSD